MAKGMGLCHMNECWIFHNINSITVTFAQWFIMLLASCLVKSLFFHGSNLWGKAIVFMHTSSTHDAQNMCIFPLNKWKLKQAMLIRYPHTVMVNIENYYGEHKDHTKWLSLISNHFAKKTFFLAWHFFMHMLIISVSNVQSIRKLQ